MLTFYPFLCLGIIYICTVRNSVFGPSWKIKFSHYSTTFFNLKRIVSDELMRWRKIFTVVHNGSWERSGLCQAVAYSTQGQFHRNQRTVGSVILHLGYSCVCRQDIAQYLWTPTIDVGSPDWTAVNWKWSNDRYYLNIKTNFLLNIETLGSDIVNYRLLPQGFQI